MVRIIIQLNRTMSQIILKIITLENTNNLNNSTNRYEDTNIYNEQPNNSKK